MVSSAHFGGKKGPKVYLGFLNSLHVKLLIRVKRLIINAICIVFTMASV